MKNKNKKRSSYLSARDIRLAIRPVVIWGYGKSQNFVCRLEINAAGIAVFTGEKGGHKLCNDSWEKFVKRLIEGRKKKKPAKLKPPRSDRFMWQEKDIIWGG
jgi:hypothetical protein